MTATKNEGPPRSRGHRFLKEAIGDDGRRRPDAPELATRAILRSLGFYYRVRNRDLPGSPDIANRRRKWAVFVNGCFWHGHKNCPKTKSDRATHSGQERTVLERQARPKQT